MPKPSKRPPKKAFKKFLKASSEKTDLPPFREPKKDLPKGIGAGIPDFGEKAALSQSAAFPGIPDFGDSDKAVSEKDDKLRREAAMEVEEAKNLPAPKDNIERTPTGIKGLDALIRGGFPKWSSILVSGSAGTGKTILSLQFLVNGAMMYNEPGIYISLEEDVNRVKKYMNATFGWPLEELEKKKKLAFVKSDIYDFDKFKSLIETNVEKMGAQRIVIDPLTVISLFFEKPLDIRRSLLDLDKLLKKLNCTTLLTTEVPEGMNAISSFGIEEFTCDGIVLLSFSFGVPRLITIRKMRATEHDTDARPFEIKYSKGIVVYPSKELFKFWKS